MSILRYAGHRLRARVLAGDEPNWLVSHIRRQYIRQCILATPTWVNRSRLRDLERKCREKTSFTGIRHVLDHQIPITHPYVCGLTVPENINIVPIKTNIIKSNHWCEHHGELFPRTEQMVMTL